MPPESGASSLKKFLEKAWVLCVPLSGLCPADDDTLPLSQSEPASRLIGAPPTSTELPSSVCDRAGPAVSNTNSTASNLARKKVALFDYRA